MLGMIPAPYRWLAYGVIAVGLMGAGAYIGSRNEAARHAKTKAEYAANLAEAVEKARIATLRVRESEAASAVRLADVDAQHQEALRHARTETRDQVLRDLRSGRVSLRLPVHACTATVPAAGQAAARTGQRDGQADGGGGDALAVAVAEQVGIAARADASLTACQATIREYHLLTEEAAR